MTEISKRNLIKRWKTMSEADLGCDVEPIAREMYSLVQSVLECGSYNGCAECLARVIRGYEINCQPDIEDFHYTNCLDLNVLVATERGLNDFDWYMMEHLGWRDRYLFVVFLG